LFANTDRVGAPSVVLINEAAARLVWPGENAIGKRVELYPGDASIRAAKVIGIVGDVRQFVDSLAKPEVYVPYAQFPISQMMIFVRVAGDPVAIAASARSAILELAPQYPVYDIQPMTTRAAGAAAPARFSAVLLGLFAATALTLGAIGMYGVMALVVTARTREIGIRMALGADQHGVRRLVVSEGVKLLSVGVVLGLAGALASTRVLQKLLFDLSPTDPVTYGAIVALLGLATIAASWIPARRASRVDPVAALRAD
jgi:putative ABC transport system permease protein